MRRFMTLGVLGLMLMVPDYASAQIFFGGGNRGRGGDFWYGGIGRGGLYGGYGQGGWGYGNRGWGYGYGGYGGYGGYNRPYYWGNSYSYYPSWGRGWNGWDDGYAYSYPGTTYSYSYPGTTYYYGTPSTSFDSSGYSGVYQAGYSASDNNRVRLQIRMPDPSAELFIQGQRMNVMGPEQLFVSPDLDSGKTYTYTIVMRRNTGGRDGEVKRTLDVRPGNTYTVDFTRTDSNQSMDQDRSRDTERLPSVQPGSTQDSNRSDTDRSRTPPPPPRDRDD